MIDQGAADEKEQSLSYISEHDSENKGVGQSDEHGGIDLVVCRKPVHLNKHLKRFEQFRVFQLGGRFSEVGVVVILDDYEHFVVVLNLFQEFFYIILRHPSAEDVVIFFVILHSGGKFTDVEVVGKFFQTVLCSYELRRPVR